MTSNKTEILAWEVADTVLYGDVMVVRLSDYDAMQSAYEEELFRVRQDRDTHFGTLARAIDQIAEMEAERDQLRKDADRLDFIAQHPGWLHSRKGWWGCVNPFTNYSYPMFKTPRDAIDYALSTYREGGES